MSASRSDGSIGNITYPAWNGKTPMATVIAGYFKFLRQSFPNERISADLFGLSTVNNDDLGIGQVIQERLRIFRLCVPDGLSVALCKWIYGYKYPAAYPYQVIAYSLEHGLAKLLAMGTPANTSSTRSRRAHSISALCQTQNFARGFRISILVRQALRVRSIRLIWFGRKSRRSMTRSGPRPRASIMVVGCYGTRRTIIRLRRCTRNNYRGSTSIISMH